MDDTLQSAHDCLCTSPRCWHRIGAVRNDVKRDLLIASRKDLDDDRHHFIPRASLKTIFSQEGVQKMLRVLLGSMENSLIDEIARYVGPADTKCPNCQQYWCTGRRVLFATLVLLEKEDTIVNFRDCSTPVCDSTLPLREPQDEGQSAEVEVLVSILQNWDSQQRELFYHLQWQMRSPYFEMRNLEVLLSRQHQLLSDELVLPWTVNKKLAEHIDGEFSAVHEIQIHQDHHNYAEINSRFALKVFDAKVAPEMAELTFEKEFNANMKLTHSRVVPLLSAFQHRDKFYLIFPWAAGGSLQDLWQNYDKVQSSPGRTASWYTTLWMLDQCFGIADALAKVHGYNTWDNEDEQPSEPQLHQDIKPENIVCCRDNETGQYVLKLTDFGLSVALDRDSSLPHRKIVQSKSYRPPEADIMGYDINQTWDIWCLGCLYLEFVTWVVLGWASVEGFRNQRLTEMDDEDVDTNFLPMEEDVFFRKTRNKTLWRWLSKSPRHIRASIKPSVTSHIENLSKHESCDPILQELIYYVKIEMLVIDSSARSTSEKVRNALHGMVERARPRRIR